MTLAASSGNREMQKLGKSRRQGSGYRRPAGRTSVRDPLGRSPSSAGASSASPGPSGAARPDPRAPLPGPGAPSRGHRGAGAASHGRCGRGRRVPMPRSPLRSRRPAEGPGKVRLFPGPRGVPALPTPRGVSATGAGVWAGPASPGPSLTSAAAPPARSRRPPRSA